MENALHSIQTLAQTLHSKASSWLSAAPCLAQSRRCYDLPLHLAGVSSIDDRLARISMSPDLTRRISSAYQAVASALAQSTLDDYLGLIRELEDSHTYCEPSGSQDHHFLCPLSEGIRETFIATYQRQMRALADEAVDRVRTRLGGSERTLVVPSCRGMDHTMIFEFAFSQSKTLTAPDRRILAQATGRSEKQVSIWFQNRRAREKHSVITKREYPTTISELEERLRIQQQAFKAQRNGSDGSGNESHDSGYASAAPRRPSSVCSVDELCKLLEAFHLSDEACQIPSPKKTKKTNLRRVSTSSEDSSVPQPAARRQATRRTRRKAAPAADPQPVLPISVVGAPRPLSTAAESEGPGSVSTLVGAPRSAATISPVEHFPSTRRSPSVAATSANKAQRPRNGAPYPTRRPTRKPVPCLSRSASSSSSSSDESPPSLDLTRTQRGKNVCLSTGADQLYYRDAATGDFVPVAGSGILALDIGGAAAEPAAPAVCGRVSLNDKVLLGSPGQPVFAPDDEPRALSSNFLRAEPATSVDAMHQAPAHLDFSYLVGDLQSSSAPVVDIALPELLNSAHPSVVTKDTWQYAMPLDVVNHSYDQSWTTPVAPANNWAQLLGLE